MEILLLLRNHEHRAQSNDHQDVDAIVTLTTRGLLVVNAREALRGVEVQRPSGRNQGRRALLRLGVAVGAEAAVRHPSVKEPGRHVVRRREKSLLLLHRRSVEVDLLVRERGMMLV
jgi:hypothetical protein